MSWTCPSCGAVYAPAPADAETVNGCPECGRWLDTDARMAAVPYRLILAAAVAALAVMLGVAIGFEAWTAATVLAFAVLAGALLIATTL